MQIINSLLETDCVIGNVEFKKRKFFSIQNKFFSVYSQHLIGDGLQEVKLSRRVKKENIKSFCWVQKFTQERKREKNKQRSDVSRFVCEQRRNVKKVFLTEKREKTSSDVDILNFNVEL